MGHNLHAVYEAVRKSSANSALSTAATKVPPMTSEPPPPRRCRWKIRAWYRNHGNIDAQLQGFQARPAPRTLLARRINSFIDNIAVRQIVFFRKDIGGNADETLRIYSSTGGRFRKFPIRKLYLRIP